MREDLPDDAEEFQAMLEAKAKESAKVAARILDRISPEEYRESFKGEMGIMQVQRTLAGIHGRRRKGEEITVDFVEQSARLFGLFSPDEAAIVASAVIDELKSQ
jgi:hypothetical protein